MLTILFAIIAVPTAQNVWPAELADAILQFKIVSLRNGQIDEVKLFKQSFFFVTIGTSICRLKHACYNLINHRIAALLISSDVLITELII